MNTKSTLFVLLLVTLTSVSTFAQKQAERIDKIVFGSYNVEQTELKEFVFSKSGEVLFTARMDKQYTHLGHLDKTEIKELLAYCDEKEWSDIVKFNPGKDYQYVRLYMGKNYTEMMLAKDSETALFRELVSQLTQKASNFKLPEQIMASQK